MIDRYRDGAVPDVDVDPELAADFDGPAPRRSPRCSTAPRSPRRSSASGSACGGSTATSRSARRGSSPRTPAQAGELDATLRSLAEGLRVVDGAARARTSRSRPEKLLAALGRRDGSTRAPREFGAAPRRQAGRRSSPPLSPKPRVIDSPHPPRPRARARGRARGRGARGGRHAHPHDRDGRGVAAAPRSPPPSATTRCSPRSATTRTTRPATTTRSRAELARARAAPALPRDRRDRARLLPRLRAARRPGARVPWRRSRSRASSASRSSSTRARPRTTRSPRSPRDAAGPRGRPALLLDARPARRVPRARLVDLVRRQRHLPEGDRPRRGRRARPARPPAGRDRRART